MFIVADDPGELTFTVRLDDATVSAAWGMGDRGAQHGDATLLDAAHIIRDIRDKDAGGLPMLERRYEEFRGAA